MTTFLVGLLGFGVGFLLGIVFRDAWGLVRDERKWKMPFSTPANRLFSIGLILTLLLNAVTAGLLIWTRASANDYYTCMADWQQNWASASKARNLANSPVQDALDNIVESVQTQDTGRFREAVKAYTTLREHQKAEQEKNPLPELPQTVCGDPESIRR